MRKGSELIGRPIIAYDTGEQFEIVRDFVFDPQEHVLLGFVVNGRPWSVTRQVLPLASVQSLGPDAVIVSSRKVVVPAERASEIQRLLERGRITRRMVVITADGCELGSLSDLYFDEQSGMIEGYELCERIASGQLRHSFLPATQPLRIGRDVVLTAAVGEAGAAQPRDTQPLEQAQPLAARRELARAVGDHSTAPIPLEVGAADAEEQPLATGRLVYYDVEAPDGTLIIRQGEQATEAVLERAARYGVLDQLYQAIGGVSAQELSRPVEPTVEPMLEDARGLRVQRIVRASRGLIVAAPGQIVTQQVLERARLYGKERALLHAVGLLQPAAERAEPGEQLDQSLQQAGQGLRQIWTRISDWFRSVEQRSSQQVEEQRIRRALGRPVTRVILDEQDRVILNSGELITNQAIELARRAKVLDLLLNSVYTREPEFTKEDLRVRQLDAPAADELQETKQPPQMLRNEGS